MGLKIQPSSLFEIEEVYQDTYIKKAFIEDNRGFNPIKHDLVKYYSCFHNSTFLGCFMHIEYSNNEIEAHSMLLKKGVKYSRDLGKLFLDICFQNKNITRITTFIPSDLMKAVNYLIKLNWKIEGIKRDCSIKNKIILDTYVLGITRRDYEFSR